MDPVAFPFACCVRLKFKMTLLILFPDWIAACTSSSGWKLFMTAAGGRTVKR